MKAKYFSAKGALTCIVLAIGFSCSKSGGSSYTSTGGGGGGSTPADITIAYMAFSPTTKTVAKGTIVKWANNDGTSHTATSNDGTTFNSGTINGGGSYSYTASVAGTFNYHCSIHGLSMSGTLIVTP